MKLFPPYESAAERGTIGALTQGGVLLLIICVILFRVGFPFPNYLSGDDTAFFFDALHSGSSSLVLTYGGYYQLLCRTAAYFHHFLTVDQALVAYYLSPILVTAGVAAVILNLPWIDKTKRMFFALSTFFLPNQDEVFNRFCCIHWQFSILVVFVLMVPELEKVLSRRTVFSILIVIAVGMSNTIVPLLSPLFALRWLQCRRKFRGEFLLLAAVTAVSAIQTATVIRSGLTMDATNSLNGAPYPPLFGPALTWVNALLVLPISCYLTSCALVQKAVHNIFLFIPCALLLILALSSAVLIWRSADPASRRRSLIWFALGYYLIIACAPRAGRSPQCYLPFYGASRYFYIPYYCFTLSFVEIALSPLRGTWSRISTVFLCINLSVFYIFNFKIIRLPDEGWNRQIIKLQETGSWDYDPRNGCLSKPLHP